MSDDMKAVAPLFIFGTGSLARLALHYAREAGDFEVKGFVVDQPSDQVFCELPVFSWEAFCQSHSTENNTVFVAIGYKSMLRRSEVFSRVRAAGFPMTNLLASASYIAKDANLGINNIIMPGTVIEPGVRLGDNNVFWSNATVCHDSTIGSHCFFASNSTVGGECTIGDRNFFGFTSTILHRRTIGNDNLIAAQSLLMESIDSGGQYVGTPAKKIKDIDLDKGVSIVD